MVDNVSDNVSDKGNVSKGGAKHIQSPDGTGRWPVLPVIELAVTP
jgi:hypothetical protein